MPQEIDIEHLRRWIGREQRSSDIITPEFLLRFSATLDGYTDCTTHPPLGYQWCLGQPAVIAKDLGPDGHPAKGGFLPPVPLPRRMWASSQISFFAPPDISRPVDKTSSIADVLLKNSKTSEPLVFVHVDHRYTQGEHEKHVLIQERQVIVYRQPSPFKKAVAQESPAAVSHVMSIIPDTTLLFRYSAVTFNGHRIHYDHKYATAVEDYPGLVVHGPLMATVLMNVAQSLRPNQTLSHFDFRGVAPAFVDEGLELVITSTGTTAGSEVDSLEIRNQFGALIMTATATFPTNSSA